MKDEREQKNQFRLEYSDPFQSPTEMMGRDDGMRRLFLICSAAPCVDRNTTARST